VLSPGPGRGAGGASRKGLTGPVPGADSLRKALPLAGLGIKWVLGMAECPFGAGEAGLRSRFGYRGSTSALRALIST
jgi:hypothetical protein